MKKKVIIPDRSSKEVNPATEVEEKKVKFRNGKKSYMFRPCEDEESDDAINSTMLTPQAKNLLRMSQCE